MDCSVSIITYQHAGFIRQCLDSVLMQETTFPFEILLGEDDSTDGTREICQKYAEKHPDLIRLFLHKREDNLEIHGRATGRRNLVNNLQQARGKYIALLDGDDYWTDPKKLQIQFDVLEADPEAAGVFHDCLIVDEETGVSRPSIGDRAIKTRVDPRSLIRENNIHTGSMFFRNVIDWHNPPDLFFNTIMVDYLVALMVAQKGPWIFVDRKISAYRRHSRGMWVGIRSRSVNLKEKESFFRLLADEPEFEAFRPAVLSRGRLELRQWAAAEAREGRPGSSILRFIRSIGGQDSKAPRYMSPARYFWALLSPVRRFFWEGS